MSGTSPIQGSSAAAQPTNTSPDSSIQAAHGRLSPAPTDVRKDPEVNPMTAGSQSGLGHPIVHKGTEMAPLETRVLAAIAGVEPQPMEELVKNLIGTTDLKEYENSPFGSRLGELIALNVEFKHQAPSLEERGEPKLKLGTRMLADFLFEAKNAGLDAIVVRADKTGRYCYHAKTEEAMRLIAPTVAGLQVSAWLRHVRNKITMVIRLIENGLVNGDLVKTRLNDFTDKGRSCGSRCRRGCPATAVNIGRDWAIGAYPP